MKYNLILFLSSLFLALGLMSCDELSNPEADLITSQQPSSDYFSSMFNLHDATWTYQNLRTYKRNTGTCFFKLKNKNFIVSEAVLNCVTDSEETAEKIKAAMISGTWISNENPFPLNVSRKKNIVYLSVPELCGRRVDFLSTLTEMPASDILQLWSKQSYYIDGMTRYSLTNGTLSQSAESGDYIQTYTTKNLFRKRLEATLYLGYEECKVMVKVPSDEMGAFLLEVFKIYYSITNPNITNSTLSFNILASSYYMTETFDIISYQPLESIILTYGLPINYNNP
ncbi:MAG: hypothetical protein K2M31_09635 [Muribaculaceae bacterium]|nr:hypothetical protein [Muribaculaceae bacterium]